MVGALQRATARTVRCRQCLRLTVDLYRDFWLLIDRHMLPEIDEQRSKVKIRLSQYNAIYNSVICL